MQELLNKSIARLKSKTEHKEGHLILVLDKVRTWYPCIHVNNFSCSESVKALKSHHREFSFNYYPYGAKYKFELCHISIAADQRMPLNGVFISPLVKYRSLRFT